MTEHCRAKRPSHPVRIAARLLSVLLLAATAVESAAADKAPVSFDIPAQAVPAALGDFAHQAGVQLFFISDGYEDVRANAVVGRYTPQRALDLLLSGTGLSASLSEESGVVVRPVGSSANALNTAMPLVAAGNMQSRSTGGTKYSAGDNGGGTVSNDDEPEQVEEVVVTGSHIRGVHNVGAAAVTFTRQELETAGYSTVEGFFQTLPQNLDEIRPDSATADGVSRIAGSNLQGASSISLRGLGPGSTLVLLNGKRRPGNIYGSVFDVSAIPLSMIERVEVVTGGRSAIYGSDAVAGVVNIVTRSGYEGAESQLYYGASARGGERWNFSQTFGRDFDNGGFVFGYDYRKDEALDATDAGVVDGPSDGGFMPIDGLYSIRSPSEQHAGSFAGHVDISEQLELYADLQISIDENGGGQAYNYLGLYDIASIPTNDSDQYSAALGLRRELSGNWLFDLSGLYGAVENATRFTSVFLPAGDIVDLDYPPDLRDNDEARLASLSIVADGPLVTLGKNTVSAAIGAEIREESYVRERTSLPDGETTPGEDADRRVASVFAELHLPLALRNSRELDLLLAARYDDYSDFGGTLNPQLGIEWSPIPAIKVRGSYSEAFRAPYLVTLAQKAQLAIQVLDDPTDPAGMTTATTFVEYGGNPDLEPEEADTWTAGIDWQPSDLFRISLSYFNIDYSGRIDQPAANGDTVLQEEFLYPGLVTRDPAPEQLAEALDRLTSSEDLFNLTGIPFDPAIDDPFAVFSNIVLFDNRRNNIALESVAGLDFQASAELHGENGEWHFGLLGTYYTEFDRRITDQAPAASQLNGPGRPVDLKCRGRVGWSGAVWSANAYFNYTDSYDDPYAASPTKVESFATADVNVRYSPAAVSTGGVADGLVLTLGIANVFDTDAPVYNSNLLGLRYDPANANPLGRYVSLRIAKTW